MSNTGTSHTVPGDERTPTSSDISFRSVVMATEVGSVGTMPAIFTPVSAAAVLVADVTVAAMPPKQSDAAATTLSAVSTTRMHALTMAMSSSRRRLCLNACGETCHRHLSDALCLTGLCALDSHCATSLLPQYVTHVTKPPCIRF